LHAPKLSKSPLKNNYSQNRYAFFISRHPVIIFPHLPNEGKSMDAELKAMSSILGTLSKLDSSTRDRVWAWVDAKLHAPIQAPGEHVSTEVPVQ